MSASSSAVARSWDFGMPLTALAVNRRGDAIAVALEDGTVRCLPASDEARDPTTLALDAGGIVIVEADADDHAFLAAGDDGSLHLLDPTVAAPTRIAGRKGAWIDHIATSPEGLRAYATGKTVVLLDAEGAEKATLDLPGGAGGLSFSPNGKRLAVSHYNGVSLWWANTPDSGATRLDWKGSHRSLVWTPDGKSLVTAMQEPALHGWRLADGKQMEMQGYAARVRAMAFAGRGRYLATTGAEQLILWPFFGGGPWGKAPLTLGGSDGRLVSALASHPKDELVAAGYEDGMMILAPLDGRMEAMIHPPVAARGAGVIGMAWNASGDALFAALENGTVLLFTLKSVLKAARGG